MAFRCCRQHSSAYVSKTGWLHCQQVPRFQIHTLARCPSRLYGAEDGADENPLRLVNSSHWLTTIRPDHITSNRRHLREPAERSPWCSKAEAGDRISSDRCCCCWPVSALLSKSLRKLKNGQYRLETSHSIFTDPFDTRTFCALSSELQCRLRLVHCSQGTVPEHLIFCWRQRTQLECVVAVSLSLTSYVSSD